MIKGIIDTIKANKGTILKRTLIIGGAILGLAIVAKMVTSNGTEEEEGIEVKEAGEVIEIDNGDSTVIIK